MTTRHAQVRVVDECGAEVAHLVPHRNGERVELVGAVLAAANRCRPRARSATSRDVVSVTCGGYAVAVAGTPAVRGVARRVAVARGLELRPSRATSTGSWKPGHDDRARMLDPGVARRERGERRRGTGSRTARPRRRDATRGSRDRRCSRRLRAGSPRRRRGRRGSRAAGRGRRRAVRARAPRHTSWRGSTATNIAPSPNHFAMRTPKSVATLRAALRNNVSTRTDSSSPFSSLNDVNPDKSTNANARSTRTAACSHPGAPRAEPGPGGPGPGRQSGPRAPSRRPSPATASKHRATCVSAARFQWFEAVVAGLDPVVRRPGPVIRTRVPFEFVRRTRTRRGCPTRTTPARASARSARPASRSGLPGGCSG